MIIEAHILLLLLVAGPVQPAAVKQPPQELLPGYTMK